MAVNSASPVSFRVLNLLLSIFNSSLLSPRDSVTGGHSGCGANFGFIIARIFRL